MTGLYPRHKALHRQYKAVLFMQVRTPGVRQDILAVGYGQFEFGPPICGMVALWSLKNPGYPLWSFSTPSGVTAVDFSVYNPNMLAVGLYDGTLAVHDVKTRQVRPSTLPTPGFDILFSWNRLNVCVNPQGTRVYIQAELHCGFPPDLHYGNCVVES